MLRGAIVAAGAAARPTFHPWICQVCSPPWSRNELWGRPGK